MEEENRNEESHRAVAYGDATHFIEPDGTVCSSCSPISVLSIKARSALRVRS
jgi:hypothetical protein